MTVLALAVEAPDLESADVMREVAVELGEALAKFGPMASPHEGYAVIQEEVDELWSDVKGGTLLAARGEAIQVAAMAIRFVRDLYPQ